MNIKIDIHLSLNCSPQSLSKQTSNSQGLKLLLIEFFNGYVCVYVCINHVY